jgi:6,7-dimethyl-8-ribityllumazine synthase
VHREFSISDGCRVAVIVSRFNEDITAGLLEGARQALVEGGVRPDDVEVVHVPGAFEIPLTAQRVARSGRYDAVVCIGCLIKGDTMHFEYIAAAVSQGITAAALQTDVPMAFGVLTTLTEAQAAERAAPGPGNKGAEAARAALEMVTALRPFSLEPGA